MSRRFPIFAVLAASLLLCLMAGCWPFDPPTKPPEDPPTPELLDRTSPENVLYNLRVIYSEKDNIVNTDEDAHAWAETYRTLFHPDTFTFYFVAGDQPDDWPDPWWGVNEEVSGFEGILKRRVTWEITDLQLSWTVTASVPDNRTVAPDDPTLLHPTWWKIGINASILLDVIQGPSITRVPGGSADFYFAPDPSDPALWVITEWLDYPLPESSPPSRVSSAVAAETESETTWGHIKAFYR